MSSSYRLPAVPNLPTFKQAGVSGVELTGWLGVYGPPRMPEEELFDMTADPWCMNNLVKSNKPEDRAALAKLRAELEKWLVEADDQGRFPEPQEVTAAKGATKPGGDPKKQKKSGQ